MRTSQTVATGPQHAPRLALTLESFPFTGGTAPVGVPGVKKLGVGQCGQMLGTVKGKTHSLQHSPSITSFNKSIWVGRDFHYLSGKLCRFAAVDSLGNDSGGLTNTRFVTFDASVAQREEPCVRIWRGFDILGDGAGRCSSETSLANSILAGSDACVVSNTASQRCLSSKIKVEACQLDRQTTEAPLLVQPYPSRMRLGQGAP